MLQKLQNTWQVRSFRERLLLGGGLGFLLLATLYAYVWQPMQQQRARLHASLPALRAQAQTMHAQMAEVKALRAQAPAAGNSDLRSTLAQSAQAQGVTLGGIVMQDASHAEVHLPPCAYLKVTAWLMQLQEQYHIRPQTVQLKATAEPGMVTGQVVMLAAGAQS